MRHTVVAMLAFALLLAGCSHSRQVQRRSNLMSYLYPLATSAPDPAPERARLQLPLRIGAAFVPAGQIRTRGMATVQTLFPPDAEKRLIDIVRKSFEGRDWVSQIVVIPSHYLVPEGGFENLSQVARLMNVDVVALVSVDQLQHSDPHPISFLYMSIIGAYVLPLDRNETRTMIDAAVFHVPTKTFLLRAPGVSRITGGSTAVDVEATLRERSMRGFRIAMEDLAKNLNTEVDSFKAEVAAGERADVDIYTSGGQSVRHGGGFGALEAMIAMLLALMVGAKSVWRS